MRLFYVLCDSYVSETQRRHAFPSQAQRHILAGLASVVGGLSAPYEKASHVHERPVVNWLWATGCHPFGPFSNTSQISQMLHDVALVNTHSACKSKFYSVRFSKLVICLMWWQRNTIYARVDSALRRIRETSEVTYPSFLVLIFILGWLWILANFLQTVQAFAAEYLKTPLGEPVKGKKEKSATELWLEKFYKKTTNLPEPFPHELVDRLERYLDVITWFKLLTWLYEHFKCLNVLQYTCLHQGLEEQLVDMSSLLYDHRLQDAFLNSSDILQSTIFTQQ